MTVLALRSSRAALPAASRSRVPTACRHRRRRAPGEGKRGARAGSKPVLPVADGGEDAHRVGDACSEIFVGRLDHRRLAAAKKGVGRLLVAESAWQGRLARIAEVAITLFARAQGVVAWLD